MQHYLLAFQHRFDLAQRGFEGLRHLINVGAELTLHHQHDAGFGVDLRAADGRHGTHRDARHIAQPHDPRAALGDHCTGEPVGTQRLPLRRDDDSLPAAFHEPGAPCPR